MSRSRRGRRPRDDRGGSAASPVEPRATRHGLDRQSGTRRPGRVARRRRGSVTGDGGTEDRQGWSAAELVLYPTLVGLAVVGVLSPGTFNVAPAEMLIELAFLVATAVSVRRVGRPAVLVFSVAFVYVVGKLFLARVYNDTSLFDFVQAYKAYFYLLGLAVFIRRRSFSGTRLAQVTSVLIVLYSVKYAYSIAMGLAHRPGVFMENNFELILLMGFFYLAYPWFGSGRGIRFAAIAATVLISGSRSSAVCLLVLYVVLYIRPQGKAWLLHLVGVTATGYGVFIVFAKRFDEVSLQEMDRYRFLGVWLRELSTWPWWEFLTGSFPLTPLSPQSCTDLSYYSVLFSQDMPGVCYSVVLHSFLLRAVLDQGILGLALLYAVVTYALRRSGASKRDVIALLTMITALASSVSAFNSVFVTIVLATALALRRPLPAQEEPPPAAAARLGQAPPRRARTPAAGRVHAAARDRGRRPAARRARRLDARLPS